MDCVHFFAKPVVQDCFAVRRKNISLGVQRLVHFCAEMTSRWDVVLQDPSSDQIDASDRSRRPTRYRTSASVFVVHETSFLPRAFLDGQIKPDV